MNRLLKIDERGLSIDGVYAVELAAKFDTPLYVLSERRIRENYRNLKSTLTCNYDKVKIYYSAKANTNLSVLKILEEEGSCLDAVSPGEVYLALKAGFTPDKILFTGTCVRNDELRYLVEAGVTINVDSLSQLDRLLKFTTPSLLSFRVNPEIGAGHHEHCITAGRRSKFGIWEEDAPEAYRRAKEAGVERFGIHMHIGSGILAVEPFAAATSKLLDIAGMIHRKVEVTFDFIDVGGGLGVPYRPGEKELDLESYAKEISTLIKRKTRDYGLGEPSLFIEPGRYIVCDAGVLLTTVNTIKLTPFKCIIGVDAGFNTLLRPAMYGSYHHILLANRPGGGREAVYDLAGPLCESGDLLAVDRQLPEVREGDLIAILNAGAYGYSMSSQYNSRPRAGEVLVKDGMYALVRRRESLESLAAGQEIAPWLR
ncbi:MAG: diaminopimelate decarboxylase [Candidatus Bathyarchaeia archaeon]